jgi:hypothetical protein
VLPQVRTKAIAADRPLGLCLSDLVARDGAPEGDKVPQEDGEEPQDEPEHWNMKTIMPSRSPSLGGKSPLPSLDPPKPAGSSVAVEDWSDMMDDGEDDLGLTSKVAQLSLSNRKGLFHPNDIKSLGFANASPTNGVPVRSSSNPLSSSTASARSPRSELHVRQPSQPTAQTNAISPLGSHHFSSLRLARNRSGSPTNLGLGLGLESPQGAQHRDRRMVSAVEMDSERLSAGSEMGSGGRSMESDLRKYSEGAEDYEDVFGKAHGSSRLL